MNLSTALRREFAIALRSAYRSWDRLNLLLSLDLGVPLNTITAPSAMPTVILEVIVWAEEQNQLEELVKAATARNPGNSELRAFALNLAAAWSGQLAPRSFLWQDLERAVLERVPFVEPRQFRERMAIAERTVCRIVLPKPEWGTGFLVGPDVVMTNYHVIEDAHLGIAPPGEVGIEFDYVAAANGNARPVVTECKLAATDWLLAFSRNGPADTDLDYALVRLDRAIGDQAAQAQSAPAGQPAVKRGWLTPKAHQFDAAQPEPLFILQHPQLNAGQATEPLKVTVGLVQGVPTAGRVRYNSNTMPGSSGSPCFLADWDLVALHHSATGEPANEGIPFKAILSSLPGDIRRALGL